MLDQLLGRQPIAAPPAFGMGQTALPQINKPGLNIGQALISGLTSVADGIGQGVGALQHINPAFGERDRKREAVAAALGQLGADPAIQNVARKDYQLGISLYDKITDNKRMEASTDAMNGYREEMAKQAASRAKEARDKITFNRLGGMLSSATDEGTYAALRSKALGYASNRGFELPFDLPNTFKEANSPEFINAFLDPDDAARFDAQEAYRQKLLAQRDQAEEGRNTRFNTGEAGRNSRFGIGEAGKEGRAGLSDTTKKSENEKNRANSVVVANIRANGGKPQLKFGKNPDGTRYVIR